MKPAAGSAAGLPVMVRTNWIFTVSSGTFVHVELDEARALGGGSENGPVGRGTPRLETATGEAKEEHDRHDDRRNEKQQKQPLGHGGPSLPDLPFGRDQLRLCQTCKSRINIAHRSADVMVGNLAARFVLGVGISALRSIIGSLLLVVCTKVFTKVLVKALARLAKVDCCASTHVGTAGGRVRGVQGDPADYQYPIIRPAATAVSQLTSDTPPMSASRRASEVGQITGWCGPSTPPCGAARRR